MQRIAELVQQVVNMPGTSIENNGQVILAGTIPGTKPVQYRYEFFKPLTAYTAEQNHLDRRN